MCMEELCGEGSSDDGGVNGDFGDCHGVCVRLVGSWQFSDNASDGGASDVDAVPVSSCGLCAYDSGVAGEDAP